MPRDPWSVNRSIWIWNISLNRAISCHRNLAMMTSAKLSANAMGNIQSEVSNLSKASYMMIHKSGSSTEPCGTPPVTLYCRGSSYVVHQVAVGQVIRHHLPPRNLQPLTGSHDAISSRRVERIPDVMRHSQAVFLASSLPHFIRNGLPCGIGAQCRHPSPFNCNPSETRCCSQKCDR